MGMERTRWILVPPVPSPGVRVTGPRPLHSPGRPATADREMNSHPGKLDWMLVQVPAWLPQLDLVTAAYLLGPAVDRCSPTVVGIRLRLHPASQYLGFTGRLLWVPCVRPSPVHVTQIESSRDIEIGYLPSWTCSLYPESQACPASHTWPRLFVSAKHLQTCSSGPPTDKSRLVANRQVSGSATIGVRLPRGQ